MTYTDAEQHAFIHADGISKQPGTPLTSTTRYLSGAAYVDQKYAEIVIDEMIGESHRAVAPALGYDLVTIIRHCFRAQRLWLRQNALLTLVLLVGAFVFTGPTVTLFVVCLLAYLFMPDRTRVRRKGRPAWQVVVGLLLVVGLGGCLFGPAAALLSIVGSGSFSGSSLGSTYDSPAGSDSTGSVVKFGLGLLAVVVGLMVVLTLHRYWMIDIITTDLARGKPAGRLRPEAREVEHRLGVVGAAQSGNIVLHAGFEPFVGAGERINAWAVATELRARPPQGAEPGAGPGPRVDIDPNGLMHHLRHRLASMRGRDLPGPAQIIGLQLRDQVVSSGTRWHDYPLIDDRTRLPYSFAEPATVEAIIRSPQTSARHFLRASVGAPDRAALGADGRTIMPAEHQSAISSTFIHVAVEGGLLYVELVSTVLGPIRQAYLDIDRYSATDDRLSPAVGEAFRRFLGDVAVAPFRLVRALYRRLTLIGAMHKADQEAAREPVYDFGSRIDVRELASRPSYANYLQGLDAEKYTRLIDKRVTEAIDEYLVSQGVDSADFVAKANFYQYNNSAVVAGDVNGSIAVGMGAKASQAGVTITTGQGRGV
ncbi:hypothetical protein ACIA5C_12825 [Actinoplanes sp. NPDC051343]|uniref:hypothetical protein n=1 Tax=Actinoplanes sp. NPDC051343 TaxID=3363906 RepID=UPI0037BBC46F